MNLQRITLSALLATILVLVLVYGQTFILPFVYAVFIWFIIKEIREVIQLNSWIKKHIPSGVLSAVALLFIMGILALVSSMLTNNIKTLSKSMPKYQKDLENVGQKLQDSFGVDYKTQLADYASNIDFVAILEQIVNSLTDLIGNTVIILIYLVFLLLEEKIFPRKLRGLYPEQEDYQKTMGIIREIDKSVGKYITLKTLVSLITGVLSYVVLAIIGLDAALFWAILIFLLNYIPTVGSLIATIFPTVFALLQFGPEEMLYVLIIVGLIQVVVGNVIEPKVMGDSLNLSALVVILSLSFWGAIWGISGMILSVPITVGIVIICAAFPQTKPIAILLSEKGDA